MGLVSLLDPLFCHVENERRGTKGEEERSDRKPS